MTIQNNSKGLSFPWILASGIINDPKSTQTEGSEDKHSYAAGDDAGQPGPLSLPLAVHERVMSGVDDREVLYCTMKRGTISARQRGCSIVYTMWLMMIKGGHIDDPRLKQTEGSNNRHSCAAPRREPELRPSF
jgi:hypothetical protein